MVYEFIPNYYVINDAQAHFIPGNYTKLYESSETIDKALTITFEVICRNFPVIVMYKNVELFIFMISYQIRFEGVGRDSVLDVYDMLLNHDRYIRKLKNIFSQGI